MKVSIDSDLLSPIIHRILNEGDEVVACGAGDADISIRYGHELPIDPQNLGLNSTSEKADYILVKWFDGVSFTSQTHLYFPLRGMMNGGLGAQLVVGSAGRFVSPVAFVPYFEANQKLTTFLQEYRHVGFVSIGMSEGRASYVRTGLEIPAFFAILRAIPGKLGEWFHSPQRLLESWLCSLVLSRYPYPVSLRSESPTEVGSLGDDVLKYFFPYCRPGRIQNGTLKTSRLLIGVNTAWSSQSFHSATRLVQHACWRVECPEKQFRTDLEESTIKVLDHVQRLHRISG